jgi:dienelactone hydrolase
MLRSMLILGRRLQTLRHWLAPALLLAGLLGHGAAPAQAPQELADFQSGPGSGAYSFASQTPKTLPELLRGGGESTRIIGHLYLPETPATAAPRLPAVVFMHGSGGIFDAMQGYWPRHFNAQGHALLALDTFGPRGVSSTAEDQSQVPFAADLADVYAALHLLASHPRIDPARIALIGTSRGGIATWRAALQRIIDSQPAGPRYAAFIPMYAGGCAGGFRVRVQPGVFGPAPMLWLHGDADDYTPLAPCQDYVERIAAAGTPARLVVLAGAGHKFDMDSQRRSVLPRVQTTQSSCPLEWDMQTMAHYDRGTGLKLGADAVRELQRSACAATGASVQGNRAARDEAARQISDFLRGVFGH